MADARNTIIEKAKELATLDQECIEFSYELKKPQGDDEFENYFLELTTICVRAFDLKNEIQLLLHEATNLSVHDPELEKLLRKIRDDEKLYSVSQYERLASFINKGTEKGGDKLDVDSSDFILSHPEAFQDFHGEVDYVSYFTRSMKVGALISRRKIPEVGLAYFREIKDSFGFGLYRSSIALCRAMLETVYFDTLKRRDYLSPNNSKIVKIDLAKEDRLFRMIKDAYKMQLIDYGTKEEAFDVKNKSNTMVLHAKDQQQDITEALTFEIIGKTINVVERLYEK